MADDEDEGIGAPSNGFPSIESSFIAAWEQSGGVESALKQNYDDSVTRPSDSSGATIGIGYDLSQHTSQEFHDTWGTTLTPDQYARLDPYTKVTVMQGKKLVNLTQLPTPAALVAMRDIKVRYDDAVKVYQDKIYPQYRDAAYKQFPGLKDMDPWSRTAVIDIGYTGIGMPKKTPADKQARADRYAEIKAAVFKQDTKALAATLRKIAAANTIPYVIKRRNAAAKLVEDHEAQAAQWELHHDKVLDRQ